MNKQPEIFTLAKSYITAAGAKKKDMLDRILSFPNAERRIYDMVYGEDQRAYLRVLVDACKKKRCKQIVAPFIIKDIDKLLSVTDDKARKTASMLIGLCAPNACAEQLKHALTNEKTRFVRPSMILALGNTDNPSQYLADYKVESGEPKHVKEEQNALKKALAKSAAPKKAPQLTLPMWTTLTCMNAAALRAELVETKSRFKNDSRLQNAFDVRTEDIKNLRCYMDALYYIGEIGEYKQASEKLAAFGLKGFAYRIEAGSFAQQKRRDMIDAVSAGFAKYNFTDNPSAYSFEIRLIKNGGMYTVFPGDNRFNYRKQSVPASAHPVTAASIMRICKPYMKENADVLDPFCGSATMLIERALIKKTNSLVGVDISPMAIKAAIANRKASGLRISLIKGDVLGYGGARYDEIISNMPFGLRVSDHESNIKLYQGFLSKLETLLKPDGVAFLFTQEKKLLREVIQSKPAFTIVRKENFNAGGLCPMLFIIKRI